MNADSAVTDPERKVSIQPAGILLNKFSLIAAAILLVLVAWVGPELSDSG